MDVSLGPEADQKPKTEIKIPEITISADCNLSGKAKNGRRIIQRPKIPISQFCRMFLYLDIYKFKYH